MGICGSSACFANPLALLSAERLRRCQGSASSTSPGPVGATLPDSVEEGPVGELEVSRTVLHCDAVEWLEKLGPQGLPFGSCVVTSLPDWSEIKKGNDLSLRGYVDWFRRAARSVLGSCREGALAVFLQTDIVTGGQWVNKAVLLCEEADACGATLLWHKVVFDPSAVGIARRGLSADYSHLLCFCTARMGAVDRRSADVQADHGRAAQSNKCGIPDLIPRGRKVYAQGMGTEAIVAVLEWLSTVKPKVRIVVDPFCGRGTVLALANEQGLPALGVDIDAGSVKSARRLDLRKLLASETMRPVSFYLERAAAGRDRKRRTKEQKRGSEEVTQCEEAN